MNFPAEQYKFLKFLILRIFYLKGENSRISKRAIHKAIFKAKQESKSDNIKNCAPFYWFNYGPYSELVEAVLNELLFTGDLTEVRVSEETSLLTMVTKGRKNHENMFNEFSINYAKDIEKFDVIVRNMNFFMLDRHIMEIYNEYAPFTFMKIYPHAFLPKLKTLYSKIITGQTTLSLEAENEELEDLLYECEANLPVDSLFENFNLSFSTYATALSRALDGERDTSIFSSALELADEIWFTFAKGVRILAHDEFYNDRVPQWTYQFNIDCLNLAQKVKRFDEVVLEKCKFKSINLTEKQKKILSAMLTDYAF